MVIKSVDELKRVVDKTVETVEITDIHTHLFAECFGNLFLYGIDELLTYHYLIAETFRYTDIPYEAFWAMNKKEQADLVWKCLFVDNTPVSEVCLSIITIFKKLGLDVNNRDINYYRDYFKSRKLSDYVNQVFKMVGLKCVVMTNDPFDPSERKIWETAYSRDDRFKAALRLDILLNSPGKAFEDLKAWGYAIEYEFADSLTQKSYEEIQRFLIEWIDRMDALYCAVSLPPSFAMDDGSLRARLINNCIIPVCRKKEIPFALMIGVTRQVNPYLKLAGDSLGKANIKVLEYLASKNPDVKFLATMLSLENQHEIVVTTRKFRNIMLFGCWWFVNNPSLIEKITQMRFELLGMSFIPQHSDCRVFEQLISKWEHSRMLIGKVLLEKYADLFDTGYELTEEQVTKDVSNLFGGNFWRFLGRQA